VTPRVAVVGSGPSGIYAADALIDQGVEVDVFDRLPTPFGLVRYGVAPDHVSIRSVRDTLDKVWDKARVRFLGNVQVGRDISVEELRRSYNAVVLTYGAAADRRLGIEGEDLPGSVAATDFVAWYTGHPDYRGPDFARLLSSTRRVAVIGVGNVAVDVVRVLSKSEAELSETDMPDYVLETLRDAPIEQVTLLGRRGPVQASFTTKELKELGELAEADVRVRADELDLDPWSEEQLANSKVAQRNLAVLTEWLGRDTRPDAQRTIDLRFFVRPESLGGRTHIESITVERTNLDDEGRLSGRGEFERLDVDLVVRSVGYRGEAMPGVPFDPTSNVVPNVDGRVTDSGGDLVPGLYVAGWIKRGPTGIIGTNKKCAVGTVASLLEDLPSLPVPAGASDVGQLLNDRGVEVVTIEGWRAIDARERDRGQERGRPRQTIASRDELMEIAGTTPST